MIRVNLLPVRAAKKRESERQQIVIFAGSIATVVVLIVFAHVRIEGQKTDLQARIRKTNGDLTDVKKIIGDVEKYKKQKADIQAKLGIIETLEARRLGPVRIMDELQRAIPSKVWLTSISQSGRSLQLNGVAIEDGLITEFITRLKRSETFSNVELIVRKLSHDNERKLKVYQFTLKTDVVIQRADGGGEDGAPGGNGKPPTQKRRRRVKRG